MLYFITLLIAFVYLAPLTYGTPGYVSAIYAISICAGSLHITIFRLDGETVNAKRLLSSWTLHFAAKPNEMA